MIYEITKGKVCLGDFEVPTQCTLRRVQHGEKRYSEDVDGMTLYYIAKKGYRQYRKCVCPQARRASARFSYVSTKVPWGRLA